MKANKPGQYIHSKIVSVPNDNKGDILILLSTDNFSKFSFEATISKQINLDSIEYHINSVNNICTYSRHNLKYAINLLQIIALEFPNIIVNNNSIDLSQIILEDIHINKLIKFLPPSKDQINDIIQIKNILYDLLVHCVDPVIIMKKIYLKLLQTIKDVNKLTDILLKYEHTIRNGSKPIYHLEGFIIEIKKLLIIKII